jgi:hypothetical protein
MRLDNTIVDAIAQKCVDNIIEKFGIKNLATMPFDALNAEIYEMIEDIEDQVDKIVVSKIIDASVTSIDDLWK